MSNPFAILDSDEEDVPRRQNKSQKAPAVTAAPKGGARNARSNANKGGSGPQGSTVAKGALGRNTHARDRREARTSHRGGRVGSKFSEPRRGRQFDRHVSGTGRGRGMKKDGRGRHNWGNGADISNETPAGEAKGEDAAATADATADADATPVEPEVEHVSLDEYFAQLNTQRQGEAFASKKAAAAAKLKAAKRESKEEDVSSWAGSGPQKKKGKKKGPKKAVAAFEEVFAGGAPAPRPRVGGDRGDRGDRRGPRPERSNFRNNNNGPRAAGGKSINIQDTSAFPALG